MKKNEFVEIFKNDLQKLVGNKLFVNVTEFAKCSDISRETAIQMLHPLKYILNGREKLFLISEVADLIYNKRQSDMVSVN